MSLRWSRKLDQGLCVKPGPLAREEEEVLPACKSYPASMLRTHTQGSKAEPCRTQPQSSPQESVASIWAVDRILITASRRPQHQQEPAQNPFRTSIPAKSAWAGRRMSQPGARKAGMEAF